MTLTLRVTAFAAPDGGVAVAFTETCTPRWRARFCLTSLRVGLSSGSVMPTSALRAESCFLTVFGPLLLGPRYVTLTSQPLGHVANTRIVPVLDMCVREGARIPKRGAGTPGRMSRTELVDVARVERSPTASRKR